MYLDPDGQFGVVKGNRASSASLVNVSATLGPIRYCPSGQQERDAPCCYWRWLRIVPIQLDQTIVELEDVTGRHSYGVAILGNEFRDLLYHDDTTILRSPC